MTDLVDRSINTIRTLAMDGVQKANSGHPGTAMALAPIAYLYYNEYLQYDPQQPHWAGRDRFVLSPGHACMLQYATLHLTGYDVSLEDLKQFRQWNSLTPGHPELGHTPGIEVTTGPLGQGVGNMVGFALAERMLAARYNRPGHEIIGHRVFGICSDGDLMEGIASFSMSGRFLSANRSGLFQLGLPLSALQTHTFSSLFGMPVSALFDHYRTSMPTLLDLCLHTGVRVSARAELRPANLFFQSESKLDDPAPRKSERSDSRRGNATDEAARLHRLSSLHYLDTGDEKVAAIIHKVNLVMGRDIPILIPGETGTGKELLAQAIHNDSPRADGPFVAVNCASIPESLIESELFGYEDGAFTGARKKGSTGKILQANGGSLFLDEIGDMPLGLQARLLRVLQERLVMPLGSNKSIPVNVALICATNRNLRDMIAKAQFREDLYYRLNGLVVRLPPLRERSDLEVVIHRLLAAEASGEPPTVSPEVMALFKRHNWPGNFRQLTNLLRTAIVMAGSAREVRMEHLPEDFLDDDAPLTIRPEVALQSATVVAAAAGRLEDVELLTIQKALDEHRGNVSAAARILGVSRNTIYRKLQK